MQRLAFVIMALAGIPNATALAQAAAVHIGQRVRVTSAVEATPIRIGVIEAIDADTLRLQHTGKAGDTLATAIPMASIAGLQVSRGRHSRWLMGLGIGFGAGAVTGAILGASSEDDLLFTSGDKAVMGGVALGVIGGAVGVVAGALTKTERWETVPIDRVTVSLVPTAGGRLRLGVRIAFGR